MALTEREKLRKESLEATLKALELTIHNTITRGAKSVSFNDRELAAFELADLDRVRRRYIIELEILDKKEAGTYRKTISVTG